METTEVSRGAKSGKTFQPETPFIDFTLSLFRERGGARVCVFFFAFFHFFFFERNLLRLLLSFVC
jgi:hypothetical protein